ncbi:MAG: sugar phosphate isomerase/epimerase [Clostridia bacterium]|nr:sugar phosphate isomerase/epimerase [Clostridia bacterium]
MNKISVQTAPILNLFGADEGFKMIHEAGFDGVDFNIIDQALPGSKIARGELDSIYDKSDEEIIEYFRPYKEAAEKYGVSFCQAHAPFPSWIKDKPVTNEYMIKVFEKCLMVCSYIGCPYLIVHPFFPGYNDTLLPEVEWELNIRQYSQLIPAIKKYGVKVCLENMFTANRRKVYAAICQDPEVTNRYIDTLNEMAGEKCFAFCLDTGHALLVGSDIYTVIRKLGNRIETLHIHDNDGWDDQHLAPYMGILDWDRFVKGMREIGYKNALSFETLNAINVFDTELAPHVLNLIGATGKMFARRISE